MQALGIADVQVINYFCWTCKIFLSWKFRHAYKFCTKCL